MRAFFSFVVLKQENPYSASHPEREVKPNAILVVPDFVFPPKKKVDYKFIPHNGLWYKYFS